uniref:non-specific serine/threonine protein kinase n=1 Tax=Euplotes harpa TaxID=151035 RepID=A0A7S3IZ77_9SPIT
MITGEEVAIKVFKPVKKSKIRREIKILNLLKDGPNILTIKDVVRDAATKTPALITEYVNQTDVDLKKKFNKFTIEDIQTYMYKTLQALDFAHSKGIMHRDIKPHNILFDPESKTLRLADWGQAEFYRPEQEYNTKVAALFYKAPELLLGYPYYDYSVDVWAAGCILAQLVFQKHPFFAGKGPLDQLLKVAKVLGTKKLGEFSDKFQIEVDAKTKDMLGKHSEKAWEPSKLFDGNAACFEDAVDLLSKMLQYDHSKRVTAREALEHRFFSTRE